VFGSSDYQMSFYAREFWRFVFVQQEVGALAKTAIEFPPMQKGRGWPKWQLFVGFNMQFISR
jgi:hypothetical protein